MSLLELGGVGLDLRLQAASLSLQAGEILAVAGPNGSGKSSLLQLASGAIAPDSGEIRLAGRPLASWSGRERARRMAVLPQRSHLEFPFRVEEVVALGRMPHDSGREVDENRVRAAMEQMEITGLAATAYTALSGGEQQRVQLARVLAQLPEREAGSGALLLDEPCAALDWAHQLRLLQALQELARLGHGVLLVLHDLNQILRFADRVLLLSGGRIVEQGRPQAVLMPEIIRQVFDVDVTLGTHPTDRRPVIVQ